MQTHIIILSKIEENDSTINKVQQTLHDAILFLFPAKNLPRCFMTNAFRSKCGEPRKFKS